MTDVLNITSTMKEAWACHELLRRLGFKSDELFLRIFEEEKIVAVELHHEKKEFRINVGEVDSNNFENDWKRFINSINVGDVGDKQLLEIYDNSLAHFERMNLVMALMKDDIIPPVAVVQGD